MMKKYIIYAPEYSHRSNGIKVLYKLSEELNNRGYDAYMYAPHDKNNTHFKYINPNDITKEIRKNDIIIYPEIVSGNPLEFQNVVRWILYYPGKNGGSTSYQDYEVLFSYSKEYFDTNILYVPTIDLNIFYDNKTQKTKDCVFVYKGGKWKDIPELNNLTTITPSFPQKQEDLVKLLQMTNILYSYDEHSSLLDEAVLCGSKVKIIRKDGYEDFTSKFNAEQAVNKLNNDVENFIKITQKMNYKGNVERNSIFEKLNKTVYFLRHLFSKYITRNLNESNRLLNKSIYWRAKHAK